jgi:hypothetical protein
MERTHGVSFDTKRSSTNVQARNLEEKTHQVFFGIEKSLASLFEGKLIPKQEGEEEGE